MNVASRELCKELCELSGWDYSVAWSRLTDTPDGREDWMLGTPHSQAIEIYPAYDLGYLLRKLKSHLADNQWLDIRINERNKAGYVGAYGTWEQGHLEYLEASTPEDAAAKLAVELFKQGVLTKS